MKTYKYFILGMITMILIYVISFLVYAFSIELKVVDSSGIRSLRCQAVCKKHYASVLSVMPDDKVDCICKIED